VVAWLRRGGALVMGRCHWWIHEMHRTGVLLLDLSMEDKKW
jgi:hypothetical protein